MSHKFDANTNVSDLEIIDSMKSVILIDSIKSIIPCSYPTAFRSCLLCILLANKELALCKSFQKQIVLVIQQQPPLPFILTFKKLL